MGTDIHYMTGPDLATVLRESILEAIHKQLDDLIAWNQRCPYVLTEAGESALREREVDR